jgi:hypothetical protein
LVLVELHQLLPSLLEMVEIHMHGVILLMVAGMVVLVTYLVMVKPMVIVVAAVGVGLVILLLMHNIQILIMVQAAAVLLKLPAGQGKDTMEESVVLVELLLLYLLVVEVRVVVGVLVQQAARAGLLLQLPQPTMHRVTVVRVFIVNGHHTVAGTAEGAALDKVTAELHQLVEES